MRTVACTLTCTVPGCGQTMEMDRDHLPPGWFSIAEEDGEVCPRHKYRIEVDDRVPADDHDDAIKEHFGRGHNLMPAAEDPVRARSGDPEA